MTSATSFVPNPSASSRAFPITSQLEESATLTVYLASSLGEREAMTIAETLRAHPEVDSARLVIVAAPDAYQARVMLARAHQLNPGVEVILRTHSDEEAALLRQENLGTVFMGEHELARAISRDVLQRMGMVVDERVHTA